MENQQQVLEILFAFAISKLNHRYFLKFTYLCIKSREYYVKMHQTFQQKVNDQTKPQSV